MASADPGGEIGHSMASLHDLLDYLDLEFFWAELLAVHGISDWASV
ncbi:MULTISPECIES: hypothetical protein [unclassified Variovorax]|nr:MULTISPECIES: hypothetical protein [unclassified Variovorax]